MTHQDYCLIMAILNLTFASFFVEWKRYEWATFDFGIFIWKILEYVGGIK